MQTMTPQAPATIPGRDGWTTAGIWVVGAAAAAMSWTGWWLLAVMCGWPRLLAALLPLAVDVYVITSARVWLRLPWVSEATRRYAAVSTMLAVVFSIAANAAYHLMESLGIHRAPWGVVVAVSGLAPLMLALVAHLQARLNHDRMAHGAAPVAAPAAGPAVAPAPAPELAPAGGPAPALPVAPEGGPCVAPEPVPQPAPERVTAEAPAARRAAPRGRAKGPDHDRARKKYRESVRAGDPLSPRELAAMFGYTRNWGIARIRECQDGPQLAEAR